MAGEERTEAATPRKRQEMRRRGSVPKSQDLASMVVLVGAIVCIHALGGQAGAHLQAYLMGSFGSLQNPALNSLTLVTIAAGAARTLLQSVGPFVLTALLLGVIANTVQTGLLVSTQSLVPDFTRLNPLAGLKRFVSGRGVFEVAKALGKLGIVAWIAYGAISGSYPQLIETMRQDIPTAAGIVGDLVYRLALRIAMFLLVLAAVDYGYQRWSYEKSIRMTKEEVKQEMKQQEGSPQTKARMRALRRRMAKQRMMADVPLADVVVTNPTHFAVALKYEAGSMTAPKVVAKGADLIAARIRELAEEHGVPIVENPPLTRALFRAVEIGREIPSEFYSAVAEVLAFVYRLNSRRRR